MRASDLHDQFGDLHDQLRLEWSCKSPAPFGLLVKPLVKQIGLEICTTTFRVNPVDVQSGRASGRAKNWTQMTRVDDYLRRYMG